MTKQKPGWLLVAMLMLAFVSSPLNAKGEGGPSDAKNVMHIGPGFIVGSGNVLPGIGVSWGHKMRSWNLSLGIDSGLFFLRNPITFYVPVLGMAYFRFNTSAEIVPTLGLSLGPIFAFGSGNVVDLMMMVNPGFQFYLDHDMDLFFRTSLGIIGSAFQFYPQIGATFRL